MISKSYSLKKFPIQLYGRKGMKGLKISSWYHLDMLKSMLNE
jgi:hypothetical protein